MGRRLRVLGESVLGGLVGGPLIVLVFWGIGYSDGFSIHAIVSDLALNAVVYVVAAVIGALVGLVVGLFGIFRRGPKQAYSPGSATPSPRQHISPLTVPVTPQTVDGRPSARRASVPLPPTPPQSPTGSTSPGEPGWYPDPYEMAKLRWWEGDRWTDRTSQ